MAIALNTWYTTSDTGGTVKLTGGASGKPEYGIRLRYKANSNSASTNKTNITVQLQVRTTKSAYNTYGPNQTTTIQGTALSAKKISKFTVNSWVTFGERTFDVAHESNGTKTITLSGSFKTTATTSSYGQYALKSGSVSVSVELPTIPRYAAITAFSLSRTINTITMSYSVDSTIDSTQYSLNNGSWTAYPSGGIITGLSPATTYNVKIRVKRTDSQLWTTTDNKSITTYDYAKITEAPNINIGNSATVKYTNPGGYTTVVGIYNTAGSVAIAEYRSTSGGTYTFSFTTTEINNMYAQTPKANQVTLRYYLRTTCNGSNYYDYVDRTFSVVNSDPIFSNFTYQDINSKTLALTGDSSKIIKKYSNLKVTISAANKMVAKNSATPVNYNVIAGSSSVSVAYSSTADVTGTINNVNSNDVTVYAVDSRGNQTPKSKSFSVVDYTECSIKTLRIDRVDGVGENIQLTMTGTYSTANFGTTTNNIKTAQLRMKAKTASNYGDWVSILNRLSISGGKITADNITISDVTFALGTEYDVQIRIADELAEDIETASISDGTVLWSAVKGKGVNFGGLYDPDEGGELQVNGKKVQNIEIIDNLSSSSTIDGLSANMGKFLDNRKVDALVKYRSNGSDFDDANTTLYTRILTTKNTPLKGYYYYIDTIFYNAISNNAPRNQIAKGYVSDDVWIRHYYDDTFGGYDSSKWSRWEPIKRTLIGQYGPSACKHYRDIFRDTYGSQLAGYLGIKIGNTKRTNGYNCMVSIRGHIYSYTNTMDFVASCYYYVGSSNFYAPIVEISNKTIIPNVYFATHKTDGSVWLIIGTDTFTWSYPGVFVDDLYLSYGDVNNEDWAIGWQLMALSASQLANNFTLNATCTLI